MSKSILSSQARGTSCSAEYACERTQGRTSSGFTASFGPVCSCPVACRYPSVSSHTVLQNSAVNASRMNSSGLSTSYGFQLQVLSMTKKARRCQSPSGMSSIPTSSLTELIPAKLWPHSLKPGALTFPPPLAELTSFRTNVGLWARFIPLLSRLLIHVWSGNQKRGFFSVTRLLCHRLIEKTSPKNLHLACMALVLPTYSLHAFRMYLHMMW